MFLTMPKTLTAQKRAALASLRYRLTIARAIRRDEIVDVASALGVTRPYFSAVIHGAYASERVMNGVQQYIHDTPSDSWKL